MIKFALELINGDERTLLKTYSTKEDALAAGPVYRQCYSPRQGLIGCISSEFDQSDQRISSAYRIHGAWF